MLRAPGKVWSHCLSRLQNESGTISLREHHACSVFMCVCKSSSSPCPGLPELVWDQRKCCFYWCSQLCPKVIQNLFSSYGGALCCVGADAEGEQGSPRHVEPCLAVSMKYREGSWSFAAVPVCSSANKELHTLLKITISIIHIYLIAPYHPYSSVFFLFHQLP